MTTYDGRNRITNQDKIKTLAETEIYKYLATLEADTIEMWRWKKKKKNISENYSKPNCIA